MNSTLVKLIFQPMIYVQEAYNKSNVATVYHITYPDIGNYCAKEIEQQNIPNLVPSKLI